MPDLPPFEQIAFTPEQGAAYHQLLYTILDQIATLTRVQHDLVALIQLGGVQWRELAPYRPGPDRVHLVGDEVAVVLTTPDPEPPVPHTVLAWRPRATSEDGS